MSILQPIINYKSNWSIKGTIILFTRNVVINNGNYPLSDYPDFFNAILDVNKLEGQNIVIFNK